MCKDQLMIKFTLTKVSLNIPMDFKNLIMHYKNEITYEDRKVQILASGPPPSIINGMKLQLDTMKKFHCESRSKTGKFPKIPIFVGISEQKKPHYQSISRFNPKTHSHFPFDAQDSFRWLSLHKSLCL